MYIVSGWGVCGKGDAFSSSLISTEVWSEAISSPCEERSMREHTVPATNWDLWSVRTDRIGLVIFLTLSGALKRGLHSLFSSIIPAEVKNPALCRFVTPSGDATKAGSLFPDHTLPSFRLPHFLCYYFHICEAQHLETKEEEVRLEVSSEDMQSRLTQLTDRERSECPNNMLMVVFDKFSFDFTPHFSLQLSEKVTGSVQLK